MAKEQKIYSKEFKLEAVRLAETSGKPIAQLARELGISDSSIHGWRKELAEHGRDAFPGSGHQTPFEEENRRLKRELEIMKQERDILKKLLLYFHDTRHEKLLYRRTHEGVPSEPNVSGTRRG